MKTKIIKGLVDLKRRVAGRHDQRRKRREGIWTAKRKEEVIRQLRENKSKEIIGKLHLKKKKKRGRLSQPDDVEYQWAG